VTVGLSAANLANKWLDVIASGTTPGTTFTGLAASYTKLHTADPGAAGATAPAAGSTTRVATSFAVAAAGSKAMNGTLPVWTNGGTSETLSHISLWDAITTGNFILSGALTTPQAWASGNTFTLSSLTIALTPIAA
jgi:hypothetical protein